MANAQGLLSWDVKRKFRLKKLSEFQRVRRYGSSYAHPLIVLVAYPNEQHITRYGVIAGRSLGNAVRRNRAKRLMRAAVQPLLPHILPGWDVILIARQPIMGAPFSQLQSAMLDLHERARLISSAR